MSKLLPYQVVKKEVDDDHFYWINDEFVPATTHILDVAGPVEYGLRNFWKTNSASEGQRIMEDARMFGSSVHHAIEFLLDGQPFKEFNKMDSRFKQHVISFYNWFHEFKPDIDSIQSELVVGSLKRKYGGTIDLICKKDGETWLIDFKTSSNIYTNHILQVSAYKEAYEEYYQEPVDHVAIMRTGSRHKVGYEFKEIETDMPAFLNIYNTYLYMNGGQIEKPPVVDVYPKTLQLFEK